jgi:hypothetical protein
MNDGSGSSGSPITDEPGNIEDDIGARDPKRRRALSPEEEAKTKDLTALTELKQRYGKWILILMGLQLAVVNLVFLLYAWLGFDFKPPEKIVQIWLVATFVQIVSVVVVITRSLFPNEKHGKHK